MPVLAESVMTRGHSLNTCSRTVHTMHRETTIEQTMQAGHGVLHCSRPGAAYTVWLENFGGKIVWPIAENVSFGGMYFGLS